MVRGNFQRRLEQAQSRKEQAAQNKVTKAHEKALSSIVKKARSAVHIWLAGEEEVCKYSFFKRRVCTDRKCKKNHTLFPLCEVMDKTVCERIAQEETKQGGRSRGRLLLGKHVELIGDNRSNYKMPALSTIVYVVIGGDMVYSEEVRDEMGGDLGEVGRKLTRT